MTPAQELEVIGYLRITHEFDYDAPLLTRAREYCVDEKIDFTNGEIDHVAFEALYGEGA